MSSMREHASRSGTGRRIWLKAFWSFWPEDEGFLGFTRPGDRDRLIAQYQAGDLVLIYATANSDAAPLDRGRALGFLEIVPERIRANSRMSPSATAWRKENGYTEAWNNALPVRRAWRVSPGQQGTLVKIIAPQTYGQNTAHQNLASRGQLLEQSEVHRALLLDVFEVSVYGSSVSVPEVEPKSFDGYIPSKGIKATFGSHIISREDGPCSLYIMRWTGDSVSLLGDTVGSAKLTVVKVGMSNAPAGRCSGLNKSLPPASRTRWQLHAESQPYRNIEMAEIAEQALKDLFSERFKSLGGEFFLGDLDILGSEFRKFVEKGTI